MMNGVNRRRWILVLGMALVLGLAALPAFAQKVKEGKALGDLDALAFAHDGLRVQQQVVPSNDLRAELGERAAAMPLFADYDTFLTREGGRWLLQVDRLTGRAALVEGSGLAWIPGAGNTLSARDLGLAPGVGEGANGVPVTFVADRALEMVRDYPELFGARPEDLEMVALSSGPVLHYLYYLHFNWHYKGIPVENAYVVFRLNSGNLVQFGAEGIDPAAARRVDVLPSLTAETAWQILWGYLGGRLPQDDILHKGALSLLPLARTQAQLGLPVEPGTGLEYRLVYTLAFRRPGVVGTWQAKVDAHTGEVLAFLDDNRYGSIKGGAYKTDQPATEVSVPFPFADYGGSAWADQAGNFAGTTGTSTMTGRTGSAGNVGGVDVVDNCGAISLAADGSGVIDFGTSAATDCSSPGGGAGNTRAARTQYYNVSMIKIKAYTYLPGNSWLQGRLTDNVNLNQTCNAYWNGSSVNFFRSGGGCWNTGELPGVSLHEWAHGMDSNDGSPAGDRGTGETYGDFSGTLQTHGSCAGGGFFYTMNRNCGTATVGYNCSGYGDCCLNCSGIREIDYAKHAQNKPYFPEDLNSNTCTGCSTFACTTSTSYAGPCGYEGHCESLVSSQAMWDLPVRDLITWGMDADSAWQLMDRLWYASRSTSGNAYSCPSVTTANGCGTSNYFTTFRVVDDCDGDLSNGTPHASAIYAAFNRHKIACTTVVNTDNNCSCATLATPVLAGTPGNNSNSLTWAAVTGATSYDVYRNDAGCSAGYTKIGNTTSLAFTDTLAVNGITYYYRIQANGTGACPPSAMSNCVTLTPVPCTTPGAPTIGTVTVPGLNQLQVSWTAGSPAGATYNIYRAVLSDAGANCTTGTYTLLATGDTASPYLDATVSGTVTYGYRVTAVDSTGGCESAQSGCAKATATGTCNMGPVFGGVTTVTNPANSTCTLTVNWSAATAYCGGPVTYTVYRSTTAPFTPGAGNQVATGVAGTSYSDAVGLTSGTTYYYIVRARDGANGVTETNTVTQSGVPTGPITTGTWSDDGGDTGAAKLALTTPWTNATTGGNTGPKVYTTGSYGNSLCAGLTTPTLQLGTNSQLSFSSRYDLESNYDVGEVQVSTNGGTSWTRVPVNYPSANLTNSGNACGLPTGVAYFYGTNNTYATYTASLATWNGQSVLLRWVLSSDGSLNGTGWLVDDISITNVQVPGTCTTGAGCTAPGAPSLSSATGDCNGVNLSWAAGTGTTNAYNVYRGTAAGGPYSKLAGMPVTGTTHSDTSAVGGTTYYYVVRGTCDVGGTNESPNSNERSGTRSPVPATPSAPGVADVDACVQSGVNVTWGTVAGATSYDLQVDGTTTLTNVTSPYAHNPGNTSSHTYTVRANNACGNGAFSTGTPFSDASGTPGTPAAPAVSDASACAASGVTITWGGVSGATGYDLLVDGTTTVSNVTSPHTYVPGNANSHNYQVRAKGGSCNGSYSTATAGTDGAQAPPSVGTLTMSTSGSAMLISWTPLADPSQADYYEVMRALAPAGPFDTSVGTAAGTIYGIRLNLSSEPPTAYYKVRAVKNGCPGPLD